MDIQKDNSNQGQEKTMSFSQDVSYGFVFDRVEKLTTALYKVTDYVIDSEPMKWDLRGKANRLLDIVSLIYKDTTQGVGRHFEEAAYVTDTIVSLCTVACASSNFSKMNFTLLRDEYRALKGSLLFEKEEVVSRPYKKAKELLLEVAQPPSSRVAMVADPGLFLREDKVAQAVASTEVIDPYSFGTENKSKKNLASRPANHKATGGTFSIERREQILGYLRKNGKSTIKDIAQVVKGCSEKTIQRELASLVRDGVLNREGERRWTTYEVRRA